MPHLRFGGGGAVFFVPWDAEPATGARAFSRPAPVPELIDVSHEPPYVLDGGPGWAAPGVPGPPGTPRPPRHQQRSHICQRRRVDTMDTRAEKGDRCGVSHHRPDAKPRIAMLESGFRTGRMRRK